MELRYLILIFVGFFAACDSTPDEVEPDNPYANLSPQQLKDTAEAWQRYITDTQEMEIEGYLSRAGYNMIRTGTGLRYEVFHSENGDSIGFGDLVQVKFELRLLDETICYSNLADSLDPKEFMVEQDNVESGLHEAIQYLQVGDKARVLMPSPRAHGLLGDLDCVPPNTPILFEIWVMNRLPSRP